MTFSTGGSRTPARRETSRWAWTYLAAGIAAVALSKFMPDDVQIAALSLVQASAAVAVLIGVRRFRPPHRAGWFVLAAGCLLLGAGAGVWLLYVAVLNKPIPYPGWSDAVFVPGYLLIAAGLAIMIRQRSPAREVQALFDALILSVGLAFANWVFLTGPSTQGADLTTAQHLLTVGYPLIDVVIVGLVTRLMITAGRLSRSLGLLAFGTVLLLGGDTAYAALAGSGSYSPGALPDQLWMLALVFVGAAALHPTMRGVAVATESKRAGTTRLRLGFMVCAMLVPSVVVIVAMLVGADPHGPALAVTTVVLLPLIAIRTVHLLQGLRRAAVADELTGLANRDEITQRLDRRSADDRAALLFIDLDHFKNVNDTLGHAAGDEVLITVSERLRSLVRDSDVVARLGGDEFVILCEAMSTEAEAERLAVRVVAALAEPFTVHGHTLYLGTSVGLVTLDGSDAQTTLRNADLAMYAAKKAGRARWVRYTQTLIDSLASEVTLDTELRQALARDQFVLHYQPVVDLASGRMVGVEALIRWQHPTRGLLPPAEFIPAAEQNGSITEIGTWALGEACLQAAHWQETRPDQAPLTIAVNISSRQLKAGLTETVKFALAVTGLAPSSLHLEVTETSLRDNPTDADAVLAALRELGVSIAIDDFGTGYSSLTYLRRFAVDSVKIDRSFIGGLGTNADDTAIVKAVIGLAAALNLEVIAEGVETAGAARAAPGNGLPERAGLLLQPTTAG
ncbi:MAG: diguanylate cyclase [Frankiaceae bacterium]|jgi:diguanylate cyclase (GGDEF)-like protein|nr:diguanylate cyclase [Frankiaceae bacterium]